MGAVLQAAVLALAATLEPDRAAATRVLFLAAVAEIAIRLIVCHISGQELQARAPLSGSNGTQRTQACAAATAGAAVRSGHLPAPVLRLVRPSDCLQGVKDAG